MSMLGRMLGMGRNDHYDRGIQCFDQGQYAQAIDELTASTSGANRGDVLTERLATFYIAESHSNLGHAALQNQQWTEARDAFSQALAINPHYADLHFHYGRACRQAGDLSMAQAAFERSLSINPSFARARACLGLTLCAAGQWETGIAELQNAAITDTAWEAPSLDDALAAHADGRDSDALALLEHMAEAGTNDVAFHSRLGVDLFKRGMFTPAADEFRRALAINPGYADIRNHLAITLNACGDYDEAITEFRRALEINPSYAEARSNLALTLRAANRPEEAADEFRRVLETDPSHAVALSHARV